MNWQCCESPFLTSTFQAPFHIHHTPTPFHHLHCTVVTYIGYKGVHSLILKGWTYIKLCICWCNVLILAAAMWVTRFGYNSVISGPNLKILFLLWSWELILGHDRSHNRLQTVDDRKRPVTSGSVRFFPFLEFSATGRSHSYSKKGKKTGTGPDF